MRRKQDWSHRGQRERESSGDMPLKGQYQVHRPMQATHIHYFNSNFSRSIFTAVSCGNDRASQIT